MLTLIVVLYFFWFVLTMVAQFNTGLSRKIRHFDYFRIFPNWQLFFPQSDKYRNIFCYRDRIDGIFTSFEEIRFNSVFFPLNIVFNPSGRIKNVTIVFAETIKIIGEKGGTVHKSVPYKAIFNYMKKNMPPAKGVERQFAIFIEKESDATTERTLLITSDFYHVE